MVGDGGVEPPTPRFQGAVDTPPVSPMEPMVGFEPTTSRLQGGSSDLTELHRLNMAVCIGFEPMIFGLTSQRIHLAMLTDRMERVAGFEPAISGWKPNALPDLAIPALRRTPKESNLAQSDLESDSSALSIEAH